MLKIIKLKNYTKNLGWIYKKVKKVSRNKELQKVYNCKRWKNLRLYKLSLNPCCEICLKENKYIPAVEVHHIVKFSLFEGNERIEKAYNINNLMSVCEDCHQKIHKEK
jgi:5-methylcytosine-specific restriction protein A